MPPLGEKEVEGRLQGTMERPRRISLHRREAKTELCVTVSNRLSPNAFRC
jgi:hypothetical protein